MSGLVAIVTDSTACLPARLAARTGVQVVQQQLRIGDEYDDEGRVPGDRIVAALQGGEEVTTAAPDPGAFFWAYADARPGARRRSSRCTSPAACPRPAKRQGKRRPTARSRCTCWTPAPWA